MSTRSKTRSENKAANPPSPTKARGSRPRNATSIEQAQKDKENSKAKKGQKGKGKVVTKGKLGKEKAKEEYCLCKGIDDGTPMVECAECKNW